MSPSAIDLSEDGLGHGERDKDHIRLENRVNGVHSNGISKRCLDSHHTQRTSSSQDEVLDLLCIGFGPASLAIAIALHDTCQMSQMPKALFLEKQPQFAWHAGMQLPGAHMQISFLKDLATPRDPRSKFTFINYLFCKGRLNQFINLSTFLPKRVEYEDYLRWCASHFEEEGKVAYGTEVESVTAATRDSEGRVTSWRVTARHQDGGSLVRKARHVVIAVGGRPVLPKNLQGLKHVAHSSRFANTISRIQERGDGRSLRFAVIGSGQSAAEIFNDLWSRFPDSEIRLIIKGASLRPSDDSPFVNEIFDPDKVDGIYNQDPEERAAAIALDRGTNYGVVRLTLLEHLYEQLYMQRIQKPDESQHTARIVSQRVVLSATQAQDSGVLLKLGHPDAQKRKGDEVAEEYEADYVFAATGYLRNAHESILSEVKDLLPHQEAERGNWPVGRDYRVLFDRDRVDEKEAGVWLQGCNETTHGLSDTLLSILAIRGGELVQSIFGSAGSR